MKAVYLVVLFACMFMLAEAGPCICPMSYIPVCGKDGVTYANECSLNCKGVELAHTGTCAGAPSNSLG